MVRSRARLSVSLPAMEVDIFGLGQLGGEDMACQPCGGADDLKDLAKDKASSSSQSSTTAESLQYIADVARM